jgi:hypothetical protein
MFLFELFIASTSREKPALLVGLGSTTTEQRAEVGILSNLSFTTGRVECFMGEKIIHKPESLLQVTRCNFVLFIYLFINVYISALFFFLDIF